MNTPAHLLIGTAAFARRDQKRSVTAALLGSLAPDISLYVMVAVSIFAMGVPAEVVFREYYYSDAWQAVFAVDNSFIIWGAVLGLAVRFRWPLIGIFASAGLLHLAMDFPLHTHDARKHFWPVTDWVFHSPFSYWDRGAHAGVVGPVEFALSVACALILLWRFAHPGIRVLVLLLLAMETMSSGIWHFVF